MGITSLPRFVPEAPSYPCAWAPRDLVVACDAQAQMTGPGRSCPSLFRFEKSEWLLPGCLLAALKLIDSLNSTSPHGLLVNWAFPTCIYACPQMVDIISTTLCSAVLLQSTTSVLDTMRTSQFHKKGTCLQLPCPFSLFPSLKPAQCTFTHTLSPIREHTHTHTHTCTHPHQSLMHSTETQSPLCLSVAHSPSLTDAR